jgi:hypothetical protein
MDAALGTAPRAADAAEDPATPDTLSMVERVDCRAGEPTPAAEATDAATPPPAKKRRNGSNPMPPPYPNSGAGRALPLQPPTPSERERIAANRVAVLVDRARNPAYSVHAAARSFLTARRTNQIAHFMFAIKDEFQLHDKVGWNAVRLLFRYIGRLAACRPGESPHGAWGNMADDLPIQAAELPQVTPTHDIVMHNIYDSRVVEVAGLACLMIAAKESEPATPSARDLGECVQNTVDPKDILASERSILTGLGWEVSPVTPRQIAEQFLVSLGVDPPDPLAASNRMAPPWSAVYYALDMAAFIRELVFESAEMAAAAALALAPVAPGGDVRCMRGMCYDEYMDRVVAACKVPMGPVVIHSESLKAAADEAEYIAANTTLVARKW